MLSLHEFNAKFMKETNDLILTNMPQTADELSKHLKRHNISANVSYSNNSAKSVSNFSSEKDAPSEPPPSSDAISER
jgi:hypothetical protein